MKNKIYHLLSIIKFVIWVWILFIVYNFINVYEDPTIAISLLFLWMFISLWWASFFIFLFLQNIFLKRNDKIRIIKNSYKLSLLFGFYSMFNVSFLLLWRWTKFIWIMLFLVFILIQVLVFVPISKVDK